MTTKLNQLIAIEKGVKSQASSDLPRRRGWPRRTWSWTASRWPRICR